VLVVVVVEVVTTVVVGAVAPVVDDGWAEVVEVVAISTAGTGGASDSLAAQPAPTSAVNTTKPNQRHISGLLHLQRRPADRNTQEAKVTRP
jgi:hypothetical protein